ncbi:hypothetical protein Goklo_023745 [Gossypium klotzschianum]|uniref:BRCT domain-containing protein n=1 Tax=Gossypium klotzschianum TaxID=34286 RepID=A0A7J8TRR5_9ROSI|nr:hypothetical protein [Gossypium klotzschianum]
MYILHDPLLEKFREIRAYQRKTKKAKAKKNDELAKLLLSRAPSYRLDMVIRDRYPTFIDALRDLDDPLTMVHLFAMLPAIDRLKIEVKRIHNCRRLCHEWQAYISRTHKLRKVFVAVKGIYYQAEVDGQKITWLAPHARQQVLTDDVDFNVMLTFLEFYEALLGFVNFQLYHSINVKYPPILDPRLEALAADLYALSRYFDANHRAAIQEPQVAGTSRSEQEQEESDLRLAQLQHQLPANEPGALMHLVQDASSEIEEEETTRNCKNLFQNKKIFLSREVPRESLLFVIPAFGGIVSWEGDGAPFAESDDSITHQIVDRPTQGHVYLSREYVQPQWVYDCINARIILPTEPYMVGRDPPPHLSPFVDDEAEGYVPDYAKTIRQLQAAAKSDIQPLPGTGNDELDNSQNMLAEGFINRTEAMEAAEKKQEMMFLEKQYHNELKMELQGVSSINKLNSEDTESKEQSLPDVEEQSAEDPSRLMMSRKKRGLYKAIEMGKQQKKERVEKLKERKRNIEAAQKSEKKHKKAQVS